MNRARAGSVFPPLAILIALIILAMLPAHSAYAQDETASQPASSQPASAQANASPKLELQSIGDVVGKRICMVSGAAFDQLLISSYEGISQDDITYYNSNA